ncbi:MAG TPA: SDR family oxidoreductase [Polyangiaceae bacterium]|jgi:thioester reductase-like protein|nr:SDR family oxidoreductase [Polyangiaceae bacterium]
MATIFFTGFPGFLGRELLPRILARDPEATAVCLVQEKFLGLARAAVAEVEGSARSLAGRVRLVTGDITAGDLGLRGANFDASDVTEIYHLAAVYDLSVGRALAEHVNVDGTRNVLALALRCPALERLHYVSTCYVSGRYSGIFEEHDLERGQAFNNFYEETKYKAEVLVRDRMRDGLPATIYRPSIVVGDSHTGVTQKLDGPYYFMRWLLRQPHRALLPVIGGADRFRFNVVPCDFVLDAMVYLSGLASSAGKTYQLCDPAPLTCREALDAMARACDREPIHLLLPGGLAKWALEDVPGVHAVLQLPSTLVDYMRHPTHYLNRATMDALAPAGIEPPPFTAYAPVMASFVRGHMSLGSAAMA